MAGLKLTSPGILLIFAIVAAGGIFLLDLTYLKPSIDQQEWATQREQAIRVENAGRALLNTQKNMLMSDSALWARWPEIAGFLSKKSDKSQYFHTFATRVFAPSRVDVAWLTDNEGHVRQTWFSQKALPKTLRSDNVSQFRETIFPANGKAPTTGVMKIGQWPALYACHPIDLAGRNAPDGQLWVARWLDDSMIESLDAAVQADLVFVPSTELPRSIDNETAGRTLWKIGNDRLAIAWLVTDIEGKPVGYFRADVPVGPAHRQAVAARRTVLIVLTLSVGLTLLVIMGIHILVAGPVVRLLKRLHQMELGDGETTNLTSDLHGEPLVLARRLESAFEKLAHMSRTDQLTGLSNRRHFEEVVQNFYYQARRYNRPLSLIAIDVDFFKAVNDTCGHPAGDELLHVVSAEIEKACRKSDLPARIGGDEFSILLPETSADSAAAVAERLRQAVAAHTLPAQKIQMTISLSIGITDLNSGEIDSPEAMVALADRALYAAKERGRNCIVMAHDLTGVNWKDEINKHGEVDQLCKKLAGLDGQFKGLFLRAVEEITQLLEQRDPNMADHARKTQHYATLIAKEMDLPPRVIKRIEVAAMLHDIGMLAMPDSVLLSKEKLAPEQLSIIRKHPLLSVRIMEGMEFLEQEIPAVRYHHEHYDGTGYPEGIDGASIPLSARILAVADSFDAMTSPRIYRPARNMSDAIDELKKQSGSQFDPAVVEAFVSVAARMGNELMEAPRDLQPAQAFPRDDA